MKRIFLFLFTFIVPSLWAQQYETMKLWPDNPSAESEMYIYHPVKAVKPAPAILICPGGGYAGLSMDNEGHNMAKWYLSKGFVAVVLKYRMPHGVNTIPLTDAEKAISIIRSNATKWNLDVNRVGVVGSSAGGHLAASLSTLAADANRPNFAVLYYPVISFDDKITHLGSKKNLLGSDVNNQELVNHYSLDKQVNEKTSKTLILVGDDDQTVPPINSILYYTALHEHHIPAALYMFPSAAHGFGSSPDFIYHEETLDLIQKWLQYIKVIN